MTLGKGGTLKGVYKIYYPDTNESETQINDYSDKAIYFLFEPLDFEDHLKLDDLLSLIARNLNEFSKVFKQYYIEEYMQEFFKPQDSKPPPEVHYWEFKEKWLVSQHLFKSSTPHIFKEHHINGIGYKNGRDEKFCLEYMNLGQAANLPLKFSPTIDLEILSEENGGVGDTHSYSGNNFTLGDIIKGIFEELSFHGSPRDRNEFFDELKSRMKSAKEEIDGEKSG